MTDEKLVQNGADEEPQDEKSASARAPVGKIARLPDAIRHQLNHRLLNGQSGAEILAWLNHLPKVKKILAAQFSGAAINHPNLSHWRKHGYRRWLDERQRIAEIRGLGLYSKGLVEAGRGNIPRGAATIASGKILRFLDTVTDENADPDHLVKISSALTPLLKAEQNSLRIGIARQRVRQRDAQLLLMRDKHQRDIAAIALRVLGDARARAIEESDSTYAEKIELIGRYLFDDLWDPRPVPTS